MIEWLNHNAGAVTAIATVALLLVTAGYAWLTYRMLGEAKQSRLIAGEPRVVGYLRLNETHENIVQLHVANLSGAAATGVSASIQPITNWPEPFDLKDSKVLRDLSFLRPHEVLKFDVGLGPDLFRDGQPAEFDLRVTFAALDGRWFTFSDVLRVESVDGFSRWQIYTIDDVARRLKEISAVLRSSLGGRRLQVDSYDAKDRAAEAKSAAERRSARQTRPTN